MGKLYYLNNEARKHHAAKKDETMYEKLRYSLAMPRQKLSQEAVDAYNNLADDQLLTRVEYDSQKSLD